MPRLSQRGYARHRGVSHTAVQKALATGRITAGPDGKIDADQADASWAATTDISKPRNSVSGKPKPSAQPSAPHGPNGAGNGVVHWEPHRVAVQLATARADREEYLAKLARLEYEMKSGNLVSIDDVREQIFALSRRARESVFGIPDRIAPILAGESDPATVHRLLLDELRAALAELGTPPSPTSRRRRE